MIASYCITDHKFQAVICLQSRGIAKCFIGYGGAKLLVCSHFKPVACTDWKVKFVLAAQKKTVRIFFINKKAKELYKLINTDAGIEVKCHKSGSKRCLTKFSQIQQFAHLQSFFTSIFFYRSNHKMKRINLVRT